MGLDIRLPIGLLFSLLGVLLVATGLLTDKEIYQRSLGININLWWGLAMLAFGAVLLLLGWLKARAAPSARHTNEGQMIEERERREGLEAKPAHHP
jgi:H+/Cl- antiporter ClcA